MRSQPLPAIVVLLLMTVTVACGSDRSVRLARSQSIVLGWHESAGPRHNRLIVDVRRVVVGRDGWTVSAAIKNETRLTLTIARRHHRSGTECGILLLASAAPRAVETAGPGLFASSFKPSLPRRLRPGESWSGTFSGGDRLPAGGFVRIQLGAFSGSGAPSPIGPEFEYITDHVFRLR